MIIVSQDKGKIINFDNMTRVYITFDEDDDDVCIRTETVDSLYEDLGYYKTEGRAKEVLKDFISRYEAIELCKREDSEIFGYTLGDYTPIYEMPED